MKTTSDHHGYQIRIHAGTAESLWNDGKVYRSRNVAAKAGAKIVNGIDAGAIEIPDFSYFEIIDWYA